MSIPDFARVSAPLQDLLEKSYKKAGRRKKSAIKSVELKQLGCGEEHKTAFANLKKIVCDAIKLSFPKPNHATCVHTDASDRFWAGIVIQTPIQDLEKAKEEQSHEPLAFLGSEF